MALTDTSGELIALIQMQPTQEGVVLAEAAGQGFSEFEDLVAKSALCEDLRVAFSVDEERLCAPGAVPRQRFSQRPRDARFLWREGELAYESVATGPDGVGHGVDGVVTNEKI